MFISREKVREIEIRLKQLECDHSNYRFAGRWQELTPYYKYEKICKICGKSLGLYDKESKLQEEKKQHQQELKRINKMLKEVE
jgi:hypothetical protein